MSGAGRGGCARWRAGVGVAAVVSALSLSAVGGAAASVAAPAPATAATLEASTSPGGSFLRGKTDGPGCVVLPPSSPGRLPATFVIGSTYRLAGADRVATAIAASQFTFSPDGAAPAAVITTSATYADALAGAALAAKVGGPLLLTSPTALEPAVAAEIARAVRPGGSIYVLGDAGAVSTQVEKTLAPTYPVTRLAGADRYATARTVATKMRALGAKGPAYLATGANFPDGLTVSTLAAHTDGLVVLSDDTALDPATQAWIEKDDPTGARTVPVGGPAAQASARTAPGPDGGTLPAAIRARAIIGVDRYDTSRRVAEAYGLFPDSNADRRIGLATGTNWPDALVAAATVGHEGLPLLLTDGNAAHLSPFTARATTDLTQDGTPTYGLAFGGADVLSDTVVCDFDQLLPSPTI